MRLSISAPAIILALALAGAADGRGPLDPGLRQCIPIKAIRDETAETANSLILHGPGSRAWRNHMPTPCDGLRSINNVGKLRFHSATPGRLCKGDTVEVTDPGVLGGLGGGDADVTRCALGGFEPISEMAVSEELRR